MLHTFRNTTHRVELAMADSRSLMSFKDCEKVINYHDAVIYGSDLKLVQSRTAWLNDACIHFYMNVLQHSESNASCLFMDASVVSFLMHQCCDDEDMEDFTKSTTFPKEGKIFVPVNDNMRADSDWMIPGGGSHWSLLVVSMEANGATQFWHFDSVKSSGNIQAASDIMNKLSLVLDQPTTTTKLIRAATPQQMNCYDCGVHMLAAAKVFASMEGTKLADYERKMWEYSKQNPDFCRELRQTMVHVMIRLDSNKRKEKSESITLKGVAAS
jgi:sentrin-specific protease 8